MRRFASAAGLSEGDESEPPAQVESGASRRLRKDCLLLVRETDEDRRLLPFRLGLPSLHDA